jgi:type VI protein secretion system component Hcp
MRNTLAGIVCLLSAATLYSQCTQPNLLVSGIQGEMAAPCTGALAFSNASLAVSNTGSQSTGSGAGAGKSTTGPLKVTRYYDSASPGLFNACVSGKHLQTVKFSNPPMTITLQDAMVTTDTWNFSNGTTTEYVEFTYSKSTIDGGGGNKITTSVIGTSRSSTMSVAAVNGDGHSQPIQSLTLTARPGNTSFSSIRLSPQLSPASPGSAAVNRAGMVKPGAGGAPAAPTESLSLNYGKIQFQYHSQNSGPEFAFTGGQVVNGNLRVSKASYTGPTTVAVRP